MCPGAEIAELTRPQVIAVVVSRRQHGIANAGFSRRFQPGIRVVILRVELIRLLPVFFRCQLVAVVQFSIVRRVLDHAPRQVAEGPHRGNTPTDKHAKAGGLVPVGGRWGAVGREFSH